MSAIRQRWFQLLAASVISYGLGEWDAPRLSGDVLLGKTKIERVEGRKFKITLPNGYNLNSNAIIMVGQPGEPKYNVNEVGTVDPDGTVTLDEDIFETGGTLEFSAIEEARGKEGSMSDTEKSISIDAVR